jgi:hypothetical protein
MNVPSNVVTSISDDKMLSTRSKLNGNETDVMLEAHLISAEIACFMQLQEQGGGPLWGHS